VEYERAPEDKRARKSAAFCQWTPRPNVKEHGRVGHRWASMSRESRFPPHQHRQDASRVTVQEQNPLRVQSKMPRRSSPGQRTPRPPGRTSEVIEELGFSMRAINRRGFRVRRCKRKKNADKSARSHSVIVPYWERAVYIVRLGQTFWTTHGGRQQQDQSMTQDNSLGGAHEHARRADRSAPPRAAMSKPAPVGSRRAQQSKYATLGPLLNEVPEM